VFRVGEFLQLTAISASPELDPFDFELELISASTDGRRGLHGRWIISNYKYL